MSDVMLRKLKVVRGAFQGVRSGVDTLVGVFPVLPGSYAIDTPGEKSTFLS